MDSEPSAGADEPYRVSLSDPGEVAVAIPHLLGFRPNESVVLVSLGGPSGGRIGLTVRADIPPPEDSAALASALARYVATEQVAAVLVAVISDAADEPPPVAVRELTGEPELPHRELVHDLALALADLDIPLCQALLIRAGRWWSYECARTCCAPGAGTPLPSGTTEIAAAAVATGLVVEPSRTSLSARIAPVSGPAAAQMAAASSRAGERYARALLRDPERTAIQSWTAILRAVARCRPGPDSAPAPLPDRDVARVVWGLTEVRVRDRALGLALGPDAPAAEILWTECTRRAPSPLDAAPATLLAVSVWLRGDGAMANVALDRALRSRPRYVLAELLSQGLATCLSPERLRAMVTDTVADLDAPAP